MFHQLRRLLPSQCPFCNAWPVFGAAGGICDACRRHLRKFPPRCRHCALSLTLANAPCPACAQMPSPLAHCVAAVDYGYPWEQVLHQFKYQQGHAWAHAMADWLLQHPDGPPLLRAADAILPVPLAPARLRERGYNQAWELTCALTRACGVRRKAHARWLSRRDTSRHQVGSSRVQRLRNLRDAFACHVQVRGQHILLVDDVMTTGATLFTLARLLQARGAASVTAMAFARTPLPGLS